MRDKLITYLFAWLAIVPAVGLVVGFAFGVVALEVPIWLGIIIGIVVVHLVFGWIFLVTNKGYDIVHGKDKKNGYTPE